MDLFGKIDTGKPHDLKMVRSMGLSGEDVPNKTNPLNGGMVACQARDLMMG